MKQSPMSAIMGIIVGIIFVLFFVFFDFNPKDEYDCSQYTNTYLNEIPKDCLYTDVNGSVKLQEI